MPKRDQRDNTKIHMLGIFALLTMYMIFAYLTSYAIIVMLSSNAYLKDCVCKFVVSFTPIPLLVIAIAIN